MTEAPPQLATVRVAFVGAGPGDPGLMTVRARDYLGLADVVILDTVHSEDEVRRFTKDNVRVLGWNAVAHDEKLTHAALAKVVIDTALKLREDGKEHLVVRLMDGDPGTFNGLAVEALACREAGVPFEVVPGVSALAAVPSYAGVPLTGRGFSTVHVISAGDPTVDWQACLDPKTNVVVFGEGREAFRTSLRELLAAGRAAETPVAISEHGTMINQVTHVTTLAEADALLAAGKVQEPTLAIIGGSVAMREQLSWFETKPLFGWNVLVPRTKDQATSMVDRLAHYGATTAVVPTIAVEPPRTPQQMERAIRGLVTGRYEWIGFTSVNAVKAVREKFADYGLDARAFAGLRIAAIGDSTAGALREWGLEPDLMPSTEQSSRGLLRDWPEYDEMLDPINRVFLPRADLATDTLVAGLQERGWEVDDVTAYRTVRAAPPAAHIREAIKSGKFDAVLFTSSSTVRNLVGIAGKPHASTIVCCIGPATARTAEEHGLHVDVLAEQASAESLVDGLAAYGMALQAELGADGPTRPSLRKRGARRKKVTL